jgi:hypothetical protein
MIAVCNTSPISSLIQIGHLALLEKLFTELWIPPEVAAELDDGVEFLGDWRTAPGAVAIERRDPGDHPLLRWGCVPSLDPRSCARPARGAAPSRHSSIGCVAPRRCQRHR